MTAKILDATSDDAATVHGWSDRDPATIVRRSPKAIWVQRDRVEQMSKPDSDAYANGKGDVVVFIRDYDAPLERYTLRSNGRWVREGNKMRQRGANITLGHRDYYRDPHF